MAVNGAHISDQHATVPIVEGLIARDLQPERLLADTTYSGGENTVVCAELGTELLAPVQAPGAATPSDAFLGHSAGVPKPATADLGDFTFNETCDRVIPSPSGHASIEQHVGENAFLASFSADKCAACPFANVCATRQLARGERHLRWRDREAATATRQRVQKTSALQEAYRLRSGIEATNAELKGRHGARKLRVRGASRVTVALTLKTLAMNVKWAVRHHLKRLLDRSGGGPRLIPAL